MKQKSITLNTLLQNNAIRLGRVHFWLAALLAIFIMASDAWNLVGRDLVFQRWEMFGVLLIVTTVVWYLARGNVKNVGYYRALIIALILVDIGLATFFVYTERGMASRGVMLYALPIVSATALLNRSALFGTAALSTAAYTLAATRYFYVNFNEGYKAELYTTVGLYSGVFFVLAAVLYVAFSSEKS